MAARASYIAGFAGTATVLAGRDFGIPLYGTMAHSFIEAFDDESAAFAAFARARPDNLVLLLDTYDTEAAARKVVALAPRLKAAGIAIRGVRLDSGDLVALSRERARHPRCWRACRRDDLCERRARRGRARGVRPGAGADRRVRRRHQPDHVVGRAELDCVYKLQEYAGLPRRKRSANKATWPGRKQVWRRYGADGRMAGDVSLDRRSAPPAGDDDGGGEPLIELVMQNGRRVRPPPSLEAIRQHAKRELERLPEPLRRLEPGTTYPVEVADELKELAAQVDRRLQMQAAGRDREKGRANAGRALREPEMSEAATSTATTSSSSSTCRTISARAARSPCRAATRSCRSSIASPRGFTTWC